jgi:predicted acylesterase/phospholipase RssA
MKKRALIISGGGARGLFAVQILKRMRDDSVDMSEFNIISGVSVGSIIGAMIAQDGLNTVIDFFPLLKNSAVYKGKFGLLSIVKNRILGKNYIMDVEPLHELLSRYISLNKAQSSGKTFLLGFVEMNSGKYETLSQFDFDNNEDYIRAIMASCSQPVIWKPQTFKTKDGRVFQSGSDGGIITVSPIGAALKQNPDSVLIINCSPVEALPQTDLSKMEQMLLRTLDLAIGESFAKDMRVFQRQNRGRKYFASKIYQTDLHEDSLNFEDESLQKLRIDNANLIYDLQK